MSGGRDGLPSGWTIAPLSSVAESCLGKMLDQVKHTTGKKLPYLRNINVRWTRFDLSDLSEMYFDDDELERYGLRQNDVLVCEGGEPGRAAVWRDGATGIKIQKALHRVRPSEALLPDWLVHSLKLDAHCGRLLEHFTGTTIKHLTGTSLARYDVRVPPLQEQKRIVAKIEALQARSDAAKEALDAIPPLLEKFRQSVLAAAFRGDLTKKWREAHPQAESASKLLGRIRAERRRKWQEANPSKQYVEPEAADTEGLPELPEGWCWATVEELASLVTKGASPGWQGFEYTSDGIVFLRSQNVGWGELRLDGVARVPESLNAHQPRSVIAEADVLLNIVGASIGRAALADERLVAANTNQAVAIIRLVAGGLDPAALMYWLLSPESQRRVHLGKVDVARANYSLADIAGLPVPLPPAKEQRAIVGVLREVLERESALKAALVEQACQLSSMNQSILAKAFRGELVPQDPNDEPASVLLDRIRRERAAASDQGTVKRGRGRPKSATP